jgi:N-acetylglucosaminyldiphosphoundecaprenol N-acetyl-beta-D-mannosaminyltransferase
MLATPQTLQGAPRQPGERLPFRLKRRPEERTVVLGQVMDMVKPEEVLLYLAQCVKTKTAAIVANHNAHSLYLLRRNPEFASFYGITDLVEVDSLPLLIWARRTGRRSRTFHRCTYLDWRKAFWMLAREIGWKVFYLGGAPGVAEAARTSLINEFGDLQIGVRDGYFDAETVSDDNKDVLAQIKAFQPDILLVGMGMPRQELWISRNHADLPNCVVMPVGAAFDYEAGVQVAAPRWIGRIGLEWLFRLVSDPRRLFRRYCVEPWFLIGMLMDDAVAARRENALAVTQDRRRASTDVQGAPNRRAADRRGSVDPIAEL